MFTIIEEAATKPDIGENVVSALSSWGLWNAVFYSVAVILIGFILTKFKILPQGTNKILTKVVMVICLPCLAFKAFMTGVTLESFKSTLFAFVYGFIVYGIMIGLSKLIFMWVKNPTRKKVFEILFVFGSTTFFGQPLIQAVFSGAYNESSVFNIAYRVFLYSYAYYVICVDNKDLMTTEGTEQVQGKEMISFGGLMKKVFLNPIIIATLAGFVLWALQLVGSEAGHWWVVTVNGKTGCFWNIQVSLPPVYNTMDKLGGLSSPLVWIAIGCTLGAVPFKKAASDKDVWIYSALKIVAGPLINLCLLLLVNLVIKVPFTVVAASTIMWATPPATVAVSYCLSSNKEAEFASSCSLIATLVAVVFIPVYMVLLTVLQSAGIFA